MFPGILPRPAVFAISAPASKCLSSGEGPRKGRPDYGRLRPNLALGFRRSARAVPLWLVNGLLRPRASLHGRLTAVGLGKPRRSPWAAIWRDFRGRGRPPRPACAQTQALAPPFPVRGWWASCQGAARRLLARPSKGAFFDTPPRRAGQRG